MPLLQPQTSYFMSVPRTSYPTFVGQLAGNFAGGAQFNTPGACTCIGVRFAVSLAGAKNYKASLWDNAGVRLATQTIACPVSGVYECIFAAGVALAAGQIARVSYWQNDSVNYQRCLTAAFSLVLPAGARTWMGNSNLGVLNIFGAGDTFPNTTAGTESYAVEPILIIP